MPTANYAAELFEIFRKGAIERFEIKLPEAKGAYALRYRLNKLRSEMRKERHYMLDVAEGVSFLIDKDNPNILVCCPSDQTYLASIRNAIGAPSEEAIKAQESMPIVTREQDNRPQISSEEALEDFFSATKKAVP